MIPFLHLGKYLTAGRPGQPTYLYHCPVCRGGEETLVMLPGSPREEVIACPQCTSEAGLQRVLRGAA